MTESFSPLYIQMNILRSFEAMDQIIRVDDVGRARARYCGQYRLRIAVHCRPVSVSDVEQALMRRIDGLDLDHPFAGSRMLKRLLQNEGSEVGRTHVRTLIRRMGIEAIYPRPRTSRPHPGQRVFPYLLRDRVIDRSNQVCIGPPHT